MKAERARTVVPLRPKATVDALEVAPSDAELVERARAGDRWAQEAIFRRHMSTVWRLARRMLGQVEDADDIVQETFSAAFRSLGSLADGAHLRSWLLTIAVNRVRRCHRKRALLRRFGLDRSVPDERLALFAAPDASPEVRAELACIDAILSRASTEERLAWMLRHVEGEKLEDVAALTQCSLATVKRRIAAVEARIQVELEGGGPR